MLKAQAWNAGQQISSNHILDSPRDIYMLKLQMQSVVHSARKLDLDAGYKCTTHC